MTKHPQRKYDGHEEPFKRKSTAFASPGLGVVVSLPSAVEEFGHFGYVCRTGILVPILRIFTQQRARTACPERALAGFPTDWDHVLSRLHHGV